MNDILNSFYRAIAGLCDIVLADVTASNFPDDTPARKNQDPITDLGQLLGIGAGADDRHALACSQIERLEDIVARSHVYALRRLIQQEQHWLALHPPGDQHLLGIAA